MDQRMAVDDILRHPYVREDEQIHAQIPRSDEEEKLWHAQQQQQLMQQQHSHYAPAQPAGSVSQQVLSPSSPSFNLPSALPASRASPPVRPNPSSRSVAAAPAASSPVKAAPAAPQSHAAAPFPTSYPPPTSSASSPLSQQRVQLQPTAAHPLGAALSSSSTPTVHHYTAPIAQPVAAQHPNAH